jgi:FkbM family methyltransferase
VKTANKIRLASLLYQSFRAARGLVGAKDVAQVRRHGLNWELDLREGIDLAIFIFGSFERETSQALQKMVRPGSIVLDIGANIGAHTLNLARLATSTGKVYAFEPTDYAFRKLKRNLELNPEIAARVVAEQVRLSCSNNLSAKVEIYSSWKVVGNERRHPKHRGIAQTTEGAISITLDDYCDRSNISKIDFIKLDVDGFETEVLSGGIHRLSRDLPTICMELAPYALQERGSSLEELFEVLKTFGYRLVSLKCFKPLPSDPTEITGRITDGSGINVLALGPAREIPSARL